MKVGGVSIQHPAALAPMEEHTNYPFRKFMKDHGAALVCSERIDARDVARRDRRALKLLWTRQDESPRAGQVSGRDPGEMAEAARVIEELGHDFVDLNFECPIRRLLDRGEGGALLADPSAIGRIVASVRRAVRIPLTLKIRTGPDADRETAVEVGRAAEAEGAAAVDLHARSVAQAYKGGADWGAIARLKAALSIPVFGSGGIRTAEDAVALVQATGADLVAVGRGCLGNPWIFRQARALFLGGPRLPSPSPAERGRALLNLVGRQVEYMGRVLALKTLSRTACYFARFLPRFEEFRRAIHQVRDLRELKPLVQDHFR
ncbi:MAG: tRNA dihydrouridine synthase [Thermoanaerobaculia bacterium]